MKQKDIVYFDGQCPICSTEIAKLQTHNKLIECQDIHALSETAQNDLNQVFNKDRLLARLHVRTEQGEWLVGARANLYLWQNTALGKWVRPFQTQPLYSFAWLGYEIWLLMYRLNKRRVAHTLTKLPKDDSSIKSNLSRITHKE